MQNVSNRGPAMPADLLALAARIEALTAPDRAMDAEIWEVIGLTEAQERHCRDWCRMDGRTDLTRARYLAAWAPVFTTSIDAAVTLVPGEAWWLVGKGKTRPNEPMYGAQIINGRNGADCVIGEGECDASAACSLLAAALRARAKGTDDGR